MTRGSTFKCVGMHGLAFDGCLGGGVLIVARKMTSDLKDSLSERSQIPVCCLKTISPVSMKVLPGIIK